MEFYVSYRGRRFSPIIVCLAALFGGCVDSSEVGKFADISKSASSSLPALVTDIEATCKRRAGYVPADQQRATLAGCQKLRSSQTGILKAQQVLLDYMGALKNLAGDQSVTYGKKLDELPGDLSDSSLNKDQVKAVSGLAKVVADAALKGYRQKQLQNLIEAANGDVQLVTKALREIISADYKRELSLEQEGAEIYFKTALKEHENEEPLAAIAVRRTWQSEQSTILAKENAADAYGKIMADIASGHQKLFDTRNKWTTKSLLDDVAPIITDLDDATKQVRKAFP
jgi:hypothetical protein